MTTPQIMIGMTRTLDMEKILTLVGHLRNIEVRDECVNSAGFGNGTKPDSGSVERERLTRFECGEHGQTPCG